MSRSRMIDLVWLLAWGLASSWWCVSAAHELGATFDEPTYVQHGLERWRSGECKGLMRLGTMPLPIDVQTLPLYVWESWSGIQFDAERDLHQLLPWARMMTLGFWWLLLTYALLAGREMAGVWAGRLAVALLALEPSYLAHASLATTDIALSACLLALVYHFWIGRESGWGWRVGLPAFWFAAAVLTKASGMVFGGFCLLVLEVHRLHRASRLLPEGFTGLRSSLANIWHESTSFRRDLRWILGIGFALVFLYVGCDWKAEPSFVKWAHKLPEGSLKSVMLPLSKNLCIFSNAGEGLVQQVKHNVRGHGTYLLGKTYPRACWHYFWTLPTIKLTLPLLLIPLLLVVARPRSLLNWALVTAAAALALGPFYRVQIGIRLILPLITLAIVGLAAAAVVAYRELNPPWQKLLATGLSAAIAWTALEAAQVWPNALCYVNPMWGGSEKGYILVSDYDWGQGLNELTRWQADQDQQRLDIWYYGTDPNRQRFHDLPMHQLPIDAPEQVSNFLSNEYLAVSVSLLYGSLNLPQSSQQLLRYLRTQTPVARTSTFLIYHLRPRAEPAEIDGTSAVGKNEQTEPVRKEE